MIENKNVSIPKIGIGLPIGKDVHPEFLKSLFARFNRWIKKYDFIILIDSAIPIDLSRNNIVELAKKDNCDYLFFIDSDVIIEDGYLERLLSHDKDVITCVYNQKIFPYYPLPRERVANDIYMPIEPDGQDTIEIDGNGMGCTLIKMDIFDKIPYPWFEFKYVNIGTKHLQTSEDLYFCQKLQNIGIKIYCDPTIKCKHIGVIIGPELSDVHREFRKSIIHERNRIVEELSESTGMSSEDIYNKLEIATKLVAEEYVQGPNDFYKTNKNYIFDLVNWHINERRCFDYALADSIAMRYPSARNILDFGSGCGQNAIELAEAGYNISMADYDSYTSQFVRFRAKKRGLDVKFYDIEKPINDKFDIILAFDVFEHIPDSEFRKTIELLKNLKAEGGHVMITASFGTQEGTHPMHYDISHEKIKLIDELHT